MTKMEREGNRRVGTNLRAQAIYLRLRAPRLFISASRQETR